MHGGCSVKDASTIRQGPEVEYNQSIGSPEVFPFSLTVA